MHTHPKLPAPRSPLPAFTLVELLVVVAVIIVLVAILLPSLESARNQAKLAKCAAQQRTLGDASRSYAVDHLTYYPNRDAGNRWDGDPMVVRWVKGAMAFDLRAKLQKYMSIEAMTDPLLDGPKMNNTKYDDPAVAADQRQNLMGDYAMFGGWHPPGLEAMERVSQRLQLDLVPFVAANSPKLTLLTADWDMYRNGTARANHPDNFSPAVMRLRQDQRPATGDRIVFNSWIAAGGSASRPVTLNFGYADGSVQRVDKVEKADPKMYQVRLSYVNDTRPTSDHPTHMMDIPGNWGPFPSIYFQVPR